jgi:hypothetical protein
MTTTDLAPYDGGQVESTPSITVPYMSFQGFRNLQDRLREDGVPQVLDASFFRQYSGSMTAQIRGTLRFFDLMDEDRRPAPLLIELVQADEQRRIEIMRGLAESKYSDVIALGTDATHGQLAEVFRNRGLTGQSITKAITFYVGLADYSGIPVSPFFKRARSAAGSNAPRPRAARPTRRRKPEMDSSTRPVVHSVVPPIEQKKSAYIDLLMKLVNDGKGGEDQKDLLDRLERALGFKPPAKGAASSTRKTASPAKKKNENNQDSS